MNEQTATFLSHETDQPIKVWCLGEDNLEPMDYEKLISKNNSRSQLALSLARSDDIVIIYGLYNLEFIDQCIEKYHLKAENIFYTAGIETNLNHDIYKHCIRDLTSKLSSYPNLLFVPRRVSNNFFKWYYVIKSKLPETNISYFGKSLDWQSVFGYKNILHRQVNDTSESVWEHLLPHIKTPRGYVCYSKEDCLQAWFELGSKPAVFKPSEGSGGKGIEFIDTINQLNDYEYPEGVEIIVEENLKNLHKRLDFYTMAYDNGKPFGKPMLQLFDGTKWLGSYTCQSYWDEKIISLTQNIIDVLKPKGYGGFDFCITGNGEAYIIDINTARFTGSHYPILYMRYNKAITRKTPYYLTSLIQIPDELTLEDFKKITDSKGISCEILSSCDRELKILIYHHNHKNMLGDYMYIRSQEDFGFEPEIHREGWFHKVKKFFRNLFK